MTARSPSTTRGTPASRSNCTFTNRALGRIIIKKFTDPTTATTSFGFTSNIPGHTAFNLSHGQQKDTGFTISTGTYNVAETVPAGWRLKSATCEDTVGTNSTPNAIALAPGETVTCTFNNEQLGKARVVKTISGRAPTGSEAFTFQLRQGASATENGTVLETKVANAANGGVIAFDTFLIPGQNYQLCETGIMPGATTNLDQLGTLFVPNSDDPNHDNSTNCINFTVAAGETKTFNVNNVPPPGGDARTIGFWKNWASCKTSKGNQKPILDQTLAKAEPAASRSAR